MFWRNHYHQAVLHKFCLNAQGARIIDELPQSSTALETLMKQGIHTYNIVRL